ncbi:hypothetical protein DI487_04730 [Flavobacterium sediminis]|uniref:Transglutaminase-like domain-containing protein n=1 Tax=Flavobacterium sediminis TaxID=2201181 RepID=A0A2U8QSW9_9FLAO|nr:transglutaminase domain-containing protein [Flavobacterium sediminis]AWM13238.1 hypothetical protein DI487_04730 [Flavobacterium sediminis]
MKSILILFLFLFFTTANAQISDFNSIDLKKADNIAKLNDGENLENLPVLSYKLTHKLSTDIEKFRAIFYWVCHNISADDFLNSKVIQMRKKFQNDSLAYIAWSNKHKKKTFKKLIKQKTTACTGYAYLVKELCFFANIKCEIINGYGRTSDDNVKSLDLVNHSWNAVQVNNKWYLCDATWASGYLNEKGYFIKEYNDGYFLTEPNLFEKNHIPEDSKWALKTNSKETKEIFPLVYGETFKLNIDPILPNEMINRFKIGEEIAFSYKSSNSEYKTSLVELIGSREIPFEIYNIQKKDDITSFVYKFNKKGNYDVHLKINDYIVATYIIKIVD